MLVVSNGDDELLQLGASRRGWHFPQMEDGTYAGYHPGHSAEAIEHLDAMCERGAQYLLFPETAYWWLDFYAELVDTLEHQAAEPAGRAETCVIFELRSLHGERGASLHAVETGRDLR